MWAYLALQIRSVESTAVSLDIPVQYTNSTHFRINKLLFIKGKPFNKELKGAWFPVYLCAWFVEARKKERKKERRS